MSRKTARRYTFEIVFQIPFHLDFDALSAFDIYPEDNLPKINESERNYVKETITGVCKHLDIIDSRIEASSKDWSLARMNRVDLAVLRLAVYEIIYTDTPPGISINEAVELAKLYSGEESGSFVNGILANISKHPEVWHG